MREQVDIGYTKQRPIFMVFCWLVVMLSGCATKDTVRHDLVNNFASLIEQHYVDPEKSKILSTQLKTSLSNGDFYKVNSEDGFVKKVNDSLQSVLHSNRSPNFFSS